MKNQLITLYVVCTLMCTKSIAQCPYDNGAYLIGPAPTTVGASITGPQTWGGDFNTLTGMQAGYTYEISTCGTPTFDSELTIYPAGGGTALAYDDDGCGSATGPSKILFTPAVSGDYDILLDEFPCSDNQIDMDMVIKLVSTGGGNPGALIIPVVVHVVYKNTNENVSDAQIFSQISALNSDYRKTNPDFGNAPAVFQGVGGDMDITFCMAAFDPQGNPTTGITRTQTSTQGFSQTTDPKSTSNGGHDNWNPQKYLNLWVCDLSGTLLGFATFPDDLASAPSKDGVVIDYSYFGTTGTSTAPFNLGRTATHEIGHWLNLRHIWGDANCGDDFVNDTPTQQTANSQCPGFPQVTCNNGPNGDMFVNYMDYVDDACMVLFTQGQKTRVNAALANFRSGLSSSNGCTVGINEINGGLSVQVYPNPSNGMVSVLVPGPNGSDYSLKIYDMLGAEYISYTQTVISNEQRTFSLKGLGKGIYNLNISNKNQVVNTKLVVN